MSALTKPPFRPEVLYLDFEGVLHPSDVRLTPNGRPTLGDGLDGHWFFEHAHLLVELMAPYPLVQVVLTTRWVQAYGLSGAVAWLPKALRTRVVGSTFDASRHEPSFAEKTHGYQVLADVAERRPRAWLALDSDYDNWPIECFERLVWTDSVLGISDPGVLAYLKESFARFFGAAPEEPKPTE
jgi:hypothetical protein